MKTKLELLCLLVSIQVFFTATIINCTKQSISTIPANSNGFTAVPRTAAQLAAYQQFIANLTKDYWNSYFPDTKNRLDSTYVRVNLIYDLLSSLPSLHLMGLKGEFTQARQWVATQFNTSEFICKQTANPDIWDDCERNFAKVIELIGRLLACHSLSNDKLFLDKATELIETFNVTIFTDFKKKSSYKKAEVFVNLALSFRYLTAITGDARYENILRQYIDQFHHRSYTSSEEKELSSKWDAKIFHTETALYRMKGDTFGRTYASQLFTDLEWVLSNKSWHLKTSNDAAKLRYLTIRKENNFMDLKHLQFGTVFALTAQIAPKVFSNETSFNLIKRMRKFVELAESIEKTVSTVSNRTAIKLPTYYLQVEGVRGSAQAYTHTPSTEVAEMYFVLWQLTGKEAYREKAWQMMQSIYKYSYDAKKKQFSILNIKDGLAEHVGVINPLSDGTLNYLYLIFSHKDTYPLDQFVFDTQGNPWPIYRETCTFTKAKNVIS